MTTLQMTDVVRRAARSAARIAVQLRPFERRWAEALFEAILGGGERDDLPRFEVIDRTVFWHALAEAPAPSFGVGLRVFVWTLTLLPLADRRWRRPFVALPREARLLAVSEWERSPSYAVRQMLAALKMLACFAYFDDPLVRRVVDPSEQAAAAVQR